MEVIKRTISLEPFKSRFNNKFMSYKGKTLRSDEFENEDYSDYGCIPTDLLLATIDEDGETDVEVLSDILYYECDYYNNKLKGDDIGANTMLEAFDILLILGKCIPLRTIYDKVKVKDSEKEKIVKKIILRHNTLRNAYFEILNFIKESTLYRLCSRRNCGDVWIESDVEGDKVKWFFDNRPTMANVLPDTSVVTKDRSILINKKSEWYKEKYIVENGKRLDYIIFLLYEIIKRGTKFNNSIKEIEQSEDKVKVTYSDNTDNEIKPVLGGNVTKEYDYTNGKDVSDAAKYDDKVGLFFTDDPDAQYSEYEITIGDEKERYLPLSIPFIDIPLCITQEYDDLGIMSPVCEMWKPGKKYFIGDKVWFKMPNEMYPRLYILYNTNIKGRDDNFLTHEISVEIYTQLYNIYNNDSNRLYTKTDEHGCKHYYLKEYYYDGFRGNMEGYSLFDTYNYEENTYDLEHWEEYNSRSTEDVDDTDGFFTELTINNSHIMEMISYSLSVDDNGRKLPFKVTSGKYTQIPFVMGEKNHRKLEGKIYCDILMEVDFLKSDNGNKVLEKYVYNTTSKTVRKYVRNSYDELYSEKYDGFTITSEGKSNYDVIRFVYFKDCRLDNDTMYYVADSGIEYDEVFHVEYKSNICTYTGDLHTLFNGNKKIVILDKDLYTYTECSDDTNVDGFYDTDDFRIVTEFSISKKGGSIDDFEQRIKYDDDLNILSNVGRVCVFNGETDVYYGWYLENGKKYMLQRVFDYIDIKLDSHVESTEKDKYFKSLYGYIGMQVNDNEFQDVDTYKDEAFIGVVDFKNKYDDVHINRGTAAALERHNILSEVNTFEDLEKYKNNFFGL